VELVTGDFAPYTGSALEKGGPVTRIVVAALENAGLRATILFRPWARGYRMVSEGSVAGAFPYIRTEQRESEVLFSDAIYTAREVVVATAEGPVEFTGEVASLAGLRYCLPLGYAVQPDLEPLVNDGSIQLVRPESMEACSLLVQRGRADFYVPNVLTFHDHRRHAPDLIISGPPLARTDNFLIVPRGVPEATQLLRRFNAGLQTLRESGAYESFFLTYGQNDPLYGEL